jgi:hypothetical protein
MPEAANTHIKVRIRIFLMVNSIAQRYSIASS